MSLLRMNRRPTRRGSALALTAVAMLIGWFVVAAPAASSADSPPLVVGSLSTEHMTNPLGIDTGRPLLGWVITSTGRGVAQNK
jgi:alpha-L-rhamnosidase